MHAHHCGYGAQSTTFHLSANLCPPTTSSTLPCEASVSFWSFIHTTVSACDNFESVFTGDQFVWINKVKPGEGSFYNSVHRILTLARGTTADHSFLCGVHRTMRHAVKLELRLDQSRTIVRGGNRLKQVPTKRESAKNPDGMERRVIVFVLKGVQIPRRYLESYAPAPDGIRRRN